MQTYLPLCLFKERNAVTVMDKQLMNLLMCIWLQKLHRTELCHEWDEGRSGADTEEIPAD